MSFDLNWILFTYWFIAFIFTCLFVYIFVKWNSIPFDNDQARFQEVHFEISLYDHKNFEATCWHGSIQRQNKKAFDCSVTHVITVVYGLCLFKQHVAGFLDLRLTWKNNKANKHNMKKKLLHILKNKIKRYPEWECSTNYCQIDLGLKYQTINIHIYPSERQGYHLTLH